MDDKVRAFLDEAKSKKLISLGLIEEVQKVYGPYSEKFPKYDRETKQYYYEVPIPIDVTDEEFEKICKYDAIQGKAPKAKKEDAPERLALSNGAEKTLGAFNTIVLVIGLVIAVLCILVGILADFDQKWILVLSGAVVIIPFILSWAVLKVYLNISNNLHEINAKLRK